MGNPHLVLFTDEDPERYHLEHMGPALEHHELFPERTNVEFARIAADGDDRRPRLGARRGGDARLRHRRVRGGGRGERGGPRAAATSIVRFRGGPLHVERRDDGEVLLGGPVHARVRRGGRPRRARRDDRAGATRLAARHARARRRPDREPRRGGDRRRRSGRDRGRGRRGSPIVDDEDTCLRRAARRRDGRPLVLFAGHVDTVPIAGNVRPGRRDGGVVHGRGAADKKAGDRGDAGARPTTAGPRAADLDVGFLFFGREEITIAESRCCRRSTARPSCATAVARDRDGAHRQRAGGRLHREPQRALVTVRGRAAHSARPVARPQRDPRGDRGAGADRRPAGARRRDRRPRVPRGRAR